MDQRNTSKSQAPGEASRVIDYLKIKTLICKKIAFQGRHLNMDRTCGKEKFEDLVEDVFYDRILKISRHCTQKEIECAFENWARIAKGLDAQKKKSYLYTSITNAWKDIRKSVAHRKEMDTAHIVSETPINHKEHSLHILGSHNGLASTEDPGVHREMNQLEFEKEHKFAACKLFFEMTREERVLLSLTFNDELGLVEIGKRTGISKSSVKRKRDALYHRLRTFMSLQPTLELGDADLNEVIRCLLDLSEQEYKLDSQSFKNYAQNFLDHEKNQGGNP